MIVPLSRMLAIVPATPGQNDSTEEKKKIRIELSFRMKIKAHNAFLKEYRRWTLTSHISQFEENQKL